MRIATQNSEIRTIEAASRMVLALCSTYSLSAKHNLEINKISLLSCPTPNFTHRSSNSIYLKRKTLFKFRCSSNEKPQPPLPKGFSMLETDPPWESSNVWSTMALYFFSLHIPLGFGGLSLVAHLLHQPDFEPQLKAVMILLIGTLELFSTLCLLQFTAKSDCKSVNLFITDSMESKRNWVLAAVLGFAVLRGAIFLTSVLAERFVVDQSVDNVTLKEIFSSSNVAQASITILYCIIAPLLEETVYRRFLLASLVPSMKWYQAVLLSSGIFAAAHLSGQNFIQLFIVGGVLGCTFCWTGDLRSSILLHSMYNALTLVLKSTGIFQADTNIGGVVAFKGSCWLCAI